jgi:hypothetical protein
MDFNIKTYYDNKLIHIIVDDIDDVHKAFSRISAFYEDIFFKDKIFTFGSYMKELNKNGCYKKDISGYNFPITAIKPFSDLIFAPLFNDEKEVIDLLRFSPDDSYVIVTTEYDEDTIKHEKAHALYYLNEGYRDDVNNIVKKDVYKELIKIIKSALEEIRYHDSHHIDEINAYIITDLTGLDDVISNKDTHSDNYKTISVSLKKAYNAYERLFFC